MPSGTASFGSSTTTALSSAAPITVGGWTFNAGAPAYTFANDSDLTFNGAGIVTNGGSLTINNSGLGTLAFQNVSSAGSATIVSDSALRFQNGSSAGNANIINTGAFNFFDSASAGSSTIINNATLGFNGTSSAGTAKISSSSFLSFLGNSSAANATITNTNDILFAARSTAGNATITNNFILELTDNATLGNAAVTSNASGLVDVSASSGSAGDGKLSVGSIAGAGFFYIGGNQLTVGSNNLSTTFTGRIMDCGSGTDCVAAQTPLPIFTGGSLVKVGTGTLTLAGKNAYTGATTVDGGTLSVNGTIASSSLTTVNAGGTLAGNGTVGNTTINGGTLAPGNSVGLLTVQGKLAFDAAARYMVEVSPSNADRVNVTGTATLGNATVNALFAPGSYVSKQYTILNASGGLGGSTFGALVDTNLPSSMTASLSYDANDAFLNLRFAFTVPGLNGNQRAVGDALTSFFNTTGGIPLSFGALSPAGLSQASGEIGTGSQQATFDAMNLFMGVMTDPFSAGRSFDAPGASGYADEALSYAAKTKTPDASAIFTKAPPRAFDRRWNVWAAGYGGSQSTDGSAAAGSNNATSRIGGTAVGADYWFSADTVAGFALAGGGTNFSVNGQGSGRSDLFQAGAFVRHTEASAYVTAAVAYGWQDVSTDRTVTAAGVDRLHAEYNANSYSARLEGGNRFVVPFLNGIGVTPYAAAQVTAFDLPAYAESAIAGTGIFALNDAAKTAADTRSELGLRLDKPFAVGYDALLTLRSRAAWAHDYSTDRSISATFQSLPGASFVVNGAAPAHDAALATASAEVKWTNGWSVAATFEGEFSDVTHSYAGKGVVRYGW